MHDKFFTLSMIKPFLKWAGGKGQLLAQFAPFLPLTLAGRGYVEPFVGSGAMFFYVMQNLHPRTCTLLDVNPELIATWRSLRDNVESVIEILTEHKARHNAPHSSEDARRRYYLAVRAAEPTHSAERAARFIYLNKTCFNGLHRLNSKGKFNVPMGRYRHPTIFEAEHLRQVSRLLQNVTLEVCRFQDCERYIHQGDWVYFDPPYEPVSRTANFTGYAKDEFTPDNQRELRDLVLRLSGKCDWILSNSTAPLIEELYGAPQFEKHQVWASRLINSAPDKRGKVAELLITKAARN
jgi:DNA adenine methylase